MSRQGPRNSDESVEKNRSSGCVTFFLIAVVVGGLAVSLAVLNSHDGIKSEVSDSYSSAKEAQETPAVEAGETEDGATSELGFLSNLSSAELPVAHAESNEPSNDVIDTPGEGGSPEGFSDLDSMLHWAIGHSDPAKLGAAAQEAKQMSAEELEKKRVEIKELMDALRMPSDMELMKIALAVLRNTSALFEDRQRAFHEILELDNGDDLDKLGGLETVLEELQRPEEALRALAAWVLGQAAQNNPTVQMRLLDLGALPQLIERVRAEDADGEESIKALYATAALVRDNRRAQENFFGLSGGAALLTQLLVDDSKTIQLRRKALSFVGDLAEQQSGHTLSRGFFLNRLLLQSILALTIDRDLNIREKAVLALRSVGGLGEQVMGMLRDDCEAQHFLDKLYKDLTADYWEGSEQFEFVQELADLCLDTLKWLAKPHRSVGTALG
eukprot:TRINITY_DN20810_c0_g1_i1.p1 TRINITY_DN20810_c0_g1~~TRINITY_DN20810_c0_g1_i1.p1  ORF type:complete len:442 (+),score=104.95 TRINITY_DN20810_c0_g1_i1:104-1429(+)